MGGQPRPRRVKSRQMIPLVDDPAARLLALYDKHAVETFAGLIDLPDLPAADRNIAVSARAMLTGRAAVKNPTRGDLLGDGGLEGDLILPERSLGVRSSTARSSRASEHLSRRQAASRLLQLLRQRRAQTVNELNSIDDLPRDARRTIAICLGLLELRDATTAELELLTGTFAGTKPNPRKRVEIPSS